MGKMNVQLSIMFEADRDDFVVCVRKKGGHLKFEPSLKVMEIRHDENIVNLYEWPTSHPFSPEGVVEVLVEYRTGPEGCIRFRQDDVACFGFPSGEGGTDYMCRGVIATEARGHIKVESESHGNIRVD
jgi:hypothetical protein